MSWTNRQKAMLKMYQRYASMPDQEYRALLHQQTGARSSTAAHLTQFHFDCVMPLIEIRAHLAETNRVAVGRRPPKIKNWYYWRERSPRKGGAGTRLLWKIDTLWKILAEKLDPEKRGPRHEGDAPRWYLHAMAAHACGHPVEHIRDLTQGEAAMLIEALKDRIRYTAVTTGESA